MGFPTWSTQYFFSCVECCSPQRLSTFWDASFVSKFCHGLIHLYFQFFPRLLTTGFVYIELFGWSCPSFHTLVPQWGTLNPPNGKLPNGLSGGLSVPSSMCILSLSTPCYNQVAQSAPLITLLFSMYVLVKGNPRAIRYFKCWSEHMKHSDKPLLRETMKNCSFCQVLNLIHRDESQQP